MRICVVKVKFRRMFLYGNICSDIHVFINDVVASDMFFKILLGLWGTEPL